jgi:hypothetical protein
MNANDEFGGILEETVGPTLRYYTSICLKVLRKTRKTFRIAGLRAQNRAWYLPNRKHHITNQQRCSVNSTHIHVASIRTQIILLLILQEKETLSLVTSNTYHVLVHYVVISFTYVSFYFGYGKKYYYNINVLNFGF